ncbi:MAG: L,D-transpeptidase [Acidimicrobiales bacterium]
MLALSACSESIEQINGGDAVVAIHGTIRPDLLGQATPHSVAFVANDVLRTVADLIEPGTPVDIVD